MDVHPTKNVSIGSDPYPYNLQSTLSTNILDAKLHQNHRCHRIGRALASHVATAVTEGFSEVVLVVS